MLEGDPYFYLNNLLLRILLLFALVCSKKSIDCCKFEEKLDSFTYMLLNQIFENINLVNLKTRFPHDIALPQSISTQNENGWKCVDRSEKQPAASGEPFDDHLIFWIQNHDATEGIDKENVFPPSVVQTKKNHTH